MTGLAVASCFPEAVREAAAGNPLPMLAGGVFGLLPDTIDFKAVKFFSRHEMDIVPDPLAPDMQMVADGIACGIAHAHRTRKTVRLRLHTIRLGADAWQAYAVRFAPDGAVHAALGPVQTTGGRPLAETEPGEATAPTPARLAIGYEARVSVAILDGPMLAFVPLPDGRIKIEFIPWHRAWSHSLLLAAAAGVAIGLAADATTGWIAALAWTAHSLVDQLGFLGAALLFPLKRERLPGLQLARSGDAGPNLALVWFAGLALFWNLARLAVPPVPLNGARLFVCAGLLPLSLLALGHRQSSA